MFSLPYLSDHWSHVLGTEGGGIQLIPPARKTITSTPPFLCTTKNPRVSCSRNTVENMPARLVDNSNNMRGKILTCQFDRRSTFE